VRAELQSGRLAPHDGLLISGLVAGPGGEPLPFTPVTISATAGTYLSTAAGTAADPLTAAPDDDLRSTLTTRTTSTGALPPVYAYATRSGLARIVVSAGTASAMARVLAGVSSDPFQVSVGGLTGQPGARLMVMGTVRDAFGNPVPNVAGIALTTGDPALGALASSLVAADASGMFSTGFAAAPGRIGRTVLSASLGVAGRPDPAWLTLGGLRVRPGKLLGRNQIRLNGHASFTVSPVLPGGGKARLRGTAAPGARVRIYAKPIGARYSTRIGTVIANRSGNWGIGTTITATTSFRARSVGRRSRLLTTEVVAQQRVTARALGDGLVRFVVRAQPNVPGIVTIYGADRRILARVKTDQQGDVTTVVRATPGRTTFRIHFSAPGSIRDWRTLTGTVR
jgi:hypothetical protein